MFYLHTNNGVVITLTSNYLMKNSKWHNESVEKKLIYREMQTETTVSICQKSGSITSRPLKGYPSFSAGGRFGLLKGYNNEKPPNVLPPIKKILPNIGRPPT